MIPNFGMSVPSWVDSAACAGGDPFDFHPEGTGATIVHAEKRAKMICAECPVRQKCLDWQLAYEEGVSFRYRYGVYGGLNGPERGRLASERAA